jgi:tRNA pseudouridine38-40 synthase
MPASRSVPSRARVVRIVVEYEGTAYLGWQRQRHGPTIQQALEEAIERVTGETSVVHGSGRTDTGVHAAGQVAHFRTHSRLGPEVLRRAINANLPDDVVVLVAEEASADFHARFGAASKVYRYCIRNAEVRGALDRRVAWHVSRTLDVASMRRAAKCLIGRHDLRAFVAEGGAKRDTVRTIKSLDIRRKPPYIHVTIEADGFLYKVVRAIVGTLVWVGSGKLSPAEFRAVLESRDRRRAGPTAPPKGLTLSSVTYPSEREPARPRPRAPSRVRRPSAPSRP